MMRKFFKVAGISIQLDLDLDLHDLKLNPALIPFLKDEPDEDIVTIHRSFNLPGLDHLSKAELLVDNPPWRVYHKLEDDHILYHGIFPTENGDKTWCYANFKSDYSSGEIFHPEMIGNDIRSIGLMNLSGFPSDSIWLNQVLARRKALMFHSSAGVVNGNGVLFIGRSEAGKTTTIRMLRQASWDLNFNFKLLCDETNIVRHGIDGWRVHGTWSHGEEPEVNSHSALLKGIFVLNQDPNNWVAPITDKADILKYLLTTIFRPLMTKDWWELEINTLSGIIREIPVYEMAFDRSGAIVPLILDILNDN